MVETPEPLTPAEQQAITDILREYAAALRDSWHDIDGRGEEKALTEMADWFDHPETFPGWLQARRIIGVCTAGGGHWSHFCRDRGCGGEPSW